MKIGIIGAGPRGLSMAERLLHNAENEKIEVVIFDPNGPGGKVWRTDQPLALLMNSVSQQVTLFTDETLSSGGKVFNGPNLYEWSQTEAHRFVRENPHKNQGFFLKEASHLTPDEQSTRCFYGMYQEWFFKELLQGFPEQLQLIKELVLKAEESENGFDLITEIQTVHVDQLIIASGHSQNELTGEEKELALHAEKTGLFYQPPTNPADVSIREIPAGEPVILRGLGLSFFDYVGLFTKEREGHFTEENGRYVYHPSGKEPIVYCGSRKGLPYYPRGKNQKQGGASAWPKCITKENLEKLHSEGKLTGTLFFDLLKKDVELFYYKKLIDEKGFAIDRKKFEKDYLTKEQESVLDDYPELKKFRWSWDKAENPEKYFGQDFTAESRKFIDWQIQEAEKGNCTGAFTSALDALKDWRDPIRQVMEWGDFSAKEYKELLWGWFTHMNTFLTIGPPISRTKELAALIDAGIFRLLPPNFTIEKGKQFTAVKEEAIVSSNYLIEARLPSTNLTLSENPLLKNLYQHRKVRPYTFADETASFKSEALEVDRLTSQVVDASGHRYTNLYCFGIPVEGVDWLTAAAARPYTDPWNLRQADKIAQEVLGK
ncbi:MULTISPECIES: FAD/NAD(P)-binding protein [unclassified Enterococcus]|jgi:hypothetical protein|uniref:FAD/NAD(P)-binding protein n=1 Tax=unclassified Enterococcus TaxID=2608891 RepID=UPI003D2DF168